jgi:tripartite-type tricarboxylate transporter receptor subunit TctC
MTRPNRKLSHLAAGAVALTTAIVLSSTNISFTNAASAQAGRTIKIVVPFAPGGAASVLARVLADEIGVAQRVTTVVENRPGAGGAIGTEAVVHAAPDGNTLLIMSPALLINPILRRQNFDPLNNFEPVCKLVDQPSVLAVNNESPYRTLDQFVAAARVKPGQLTLASVTGSSAHIAFEEFKRKANVNIALVPYPGSAPMVTALLGGHVTSMLDNFATMGEHVNAGKLRALASFAPTRSKALAQIPTFAEAGYNSALGWWGLFAPAKIPKEAASDLVRWTTAAMQKPEMKQKLEPLGLYPSNMCGVEFAELLHDQYQEFGRIIREANIKAE